MSTLSVYTIKGFPCPYCDKAVALLNQNRIQFTLIGIDENDDEAWDSLCTKSGLKTIPQIFLGETLIGGFSDLEALISGGGLTPKEIETGL